jgi:hypothetical protein
VDETGSKKEDPRVEARLEKKRRVLHELRKLGTVSAACDAVGIRTTTFYNWKKRDPVFMAAAEEAKAKTIDDLETEAIKRAKDGSDTLLIFLLKSLKPTVYKERAHVEVSQDQAVPKGDDTFDRFLREHPELTEGIARGIEAEGSP